MANIVEQHYKENYARIVKRMTFRAGTQWDAEDVVQEAYSRALKYFKSFDGSNFNRWFTTVLNNAFIDHKNQERGHSADQFEEEEDAGIACNYYNERMIEDVRKRIDKGSPIQKEVLSLWFENEYTIVDIARITNHTYFVVRQIIHRFRDVLKEKYG